MIVTISTNRINSNTNQKEIQRQAPGILNVSRVARKITSAEAGETSRPPTLSNVLLSLVEFSLLCVAS